MIPRAMAGAAAVLMLLPYLLSAPPSETPQFRLPEGVVPLRHVVDLTIDPHTPTFTGKMRIQVRIDRDLDRLWIHAKDLSVEHVALILEGRAIDARGQVEGGEFLQIIPAEPLTPGLATLSIDYAGRLDGTAAQGLYRRKIGNDWYVFATFPPIEARRAMPCFDEPRFKTPWQVSLRVPASQKALSNGAVVAETMEPAGRASAWKRVEFAETPPLPAELVGLAVGPFDAVEANGIRVLTTRGESSPAKFAAETAAPILKALEEYTGLPYAFGKLDIIALPGLQFAAIETPGLLSFEKDNLLLPPNKRNTARKRAMQELIAHEFAHQWFGNLVTQERWADVWLSEGVATWLGRKILGRETEALEKREIEMREDEAGRARIVRHVVRSRAESLDAYNPAVYEKGAAVMLMLESWLGEDKMRDLLRHYLTLHQNGNASTADLARLLPDPNAAEVLDVFLGSQGVPVVAGEVDCARLRPVLKIASTLSPVPVCWRSDTSSGCTIVHTSSTVELPAGATCPAWIHWNAGGRGYYRTLWNESSSPVAALPHLTVAEKLTLAYDLRAARSPGWQSLIETLLHDPSGAVSAAARDALQ